LEKDPAKRSTAAELLKHTLLHQDNRCGKNKLGEQVERQMTVSRMVPYGFE